MFNIQKFGILSRLIHIVQSSSGNQGWIYSVLSRSLDGTLILLNPMYIGHNFEHPKNEQIAIRRKIRLSF
jgi:hypothetical protein